jgi:hypothetical protein
MDPKRRLAILALVMVAGCGAPAASGPPATPHIACVGIPADKCDEAVASVARSLPNSAPASIEVRCVNDTCTPQSGAMETLVTLGDGSQLRSTTLSWAGFDGDSPSGEEPAIPDLAPPDLAPPAVAPPQANVPIEPICQGVPASMCRTMAETAFGEVPVEGVVRIVVRCAKPPCTDAHGTGDTLVTYSDGTIRTSSWEYAGG